MTQLAFTASNAAAWHAALATGRKLEREKYGERAHSLPDRREF
jgi:hypothetical protein